MNHKAYIFDIDGTLADTSHRQHLLNSTPKDWKGYFAAMSQDAPNRPVIQVAKVLLDTGFTIILVTGRPAAYRLETLTWLAKYGVCCHQLHMREEGDYRPDHEIKLDILNTISQHYEVQAAFDDRDSVVAMWRDAGIPCFQVNEGDF